MAKFTIQYLNVRPLARGGFGYYWQPSPALRAKGWKPVSFGQSATSDDPDRLDQARRRNAEVEQWRVGGAKPREVKRITVAQSAAQLVDRYRAYLDDRVEQGKLRPADRNPEKGEEMSVNTRKVYEASLRIFLVWATDQKKPGGEGNIAANSITAESVDKFKRALMKPDDDGTIRWHRAHGVLRVCRTMFGWGAHKRRRYVDHNPFEDFELAEPPGRDQVWDEDGGRGDIDAIVLACQLIGFPSVGLACELAEYTGQREADLVKLTIRNWQRIQMVDTDLVDALRGDDEHLMGFFLAQGKTKKPIGIPVIQPTRAKIEAAIAATSKSNALAKVPVLQIFVHETTGRAWKLREFIRRFGEARALCADPTPEAMAKGLMPRPHMADLQFRDLRRTCVVRLAERGIDDNGISSVTGHSLASIRKMLERHYKPRTTRQASLVMLSVHGEALRARREQDDKATG